MDMQDSCEFVCLLGLGLVLLLGMAKAAPSGRTNRTDDNCAFDIRYAHIGRARTRLTLCKNFKIGSRGNQK
jgi:hypothetical protein